ncbi:MAG TPA: hypothetical protein VGF30_07650, partial [Bacteroidia bacterium]
VNYEDTHIMSGDIHIRPNAILVISGCVFMPKDSRIFVYAGGKLIVDGGTIDCVCPDGMWSGIEVRGNTGSNQVYGTVGNTVFDPNQGVCEINYGSLIKNARIGVSVGGNNNYPNIPMPELDYKYTGGILQVNGATFNNCYIGVAFGAYAKMLKGTKSYIRNSTFYSGILKDSKFYPNNIPVPMQYGVYLYSITKVEITGNNFYNYTFNSIGTPTEPGYNIFDEKYRGVAINAVNSTLYVLNNQISDFRHGIKAGNNYALVRSATIKSNGFNNNLFGITGNVSYAKIDSNDFLIPAGLVDTVNIPIGSSK